MFSNISLNRNASTFNSSLRFIAMQRTQTAVSQQIRWMKPYSTKVTRTKHEPGFKGPPVPPSLMLRSMFQHSLFALYWWDVAANKLNSKKMWGHGQINVAHESDYCLFLDEIWVLALKWDKSFQCGWLRQSKAALRVFTGGCVVETKYLSKQPAFSWQQTSCGSTKVRYLSHKKAK